MFKAHNISIMNYTPGSRPSVSVPKSSYCDDRRGSSDSVRSSTVEVALLSACPLQCREDGETPEGSSGDYMSARHHYRGSQTQIHLPLDYEFPKVDTYQYPNKKAFNAALELFNKQSEVEENSNVIDNSNRNSNVKQRWECKGEVRASFQLCTVCKDLGKVKSYNEQYFLDVLEIRKYRTILCKGCFGHILKEQVGTCVKDIEEKLKLLRGETNDDDVFIEEE